MTNPQSEASNKQTILLPSLVDGHTVTSGKVGQWTTRSQSEFRNIAQSLAFQNPGEKIKSVSSIPNVWARALAMEMALHNRDNKLRNVMQKQWEGMLAAIALSEYRGWDLKASQVDLSEASVLGLGALKLANALKNLSPSNRNILYVPAPDSNPVWEDLYVFLWNAKPVGATSPSTFLWPAEEGDWTGLPWWNRDERKLDTPSFDRHITDRTEQIQLHLWLSELLSKLQQDVSRNEQAIARISGLINAFQSKIPNKPQRETVQLSALSYFGQSVIKRGSIAALNHPLKGQPRRSNVEILATAGRGSNSAYLLEPVDNSQWNEEQPLPRQWGERPDNIWIYETVSYGNLAQQDIDTLAHRWIRQKVELLKPNDLLLPELHYILQENAFENALLPEGSEHLMNGDGEPLTIILPVQPKLLDYFDPEAVVEMILVRASNEGITVTLDIPLSGMGSTSQPYRLTRTYPLKEANCKNEVPVLEVWPNIRTEKWQDYYTFYSDGEVGTQTFQVNFSHLTNSVDDLHEFRKGRGEYQIARSSKFPEYIQCLDTNTKNYIGLILLPKPPVAEGSPSIWRVGVDFGTSFTNFAIYRNQQPSTLEAFEPISLKVTASQKFTRAISLDEYFIREEVMTLPLSSVLTTKGSLSINNLKAILEGRIYVPTNPSIFDPSQGHIHTGLKWSKDGYRDIFLEHLALQISAHAARENVYQIQWALSYPSAYSEDTIENVYNQAWKKLTERLQNSSGIIQEYPRVSDPHHYITESLAMAKYFADVERLDFNRVTCIDMGGGTSDISIWQDSKLVHQCSIKLAGRDLFTRILAGYPQCLIEHYGDLPENLLDLGRDGTASRRDKFSETRLDAKLDALLRERSNDWLENKPESDCFKEFLQITALGFAGLYYYLGIVLRVLYEEGNGVYTIPKITPVYIGGNGSRLLHWLAETSEFDEDSKLNRLLSRMIAKGSGFEDIGVTTSRSRRPKNEVVFGLVVEPENSRLRGLEGSPGMPISGEVLKLGSARVEPYAPLHLPESIESLQPPESHEFEVLPKFLHEFHVALQEFRLNRLIRPLSQDNYQGGSEASDNPALWEDVSKCMYRSITAMGEKRSEAEVDPGFILGLKGLVEVLSHRWAKKWTRQNG